MSHIHFVGIGGVGTGSLATALVRAGHTVTGSDGKLYDPMKSVLEEAKISLTEGFHAQTVEQTPAEMVVIGNVIRKDNEEAVAWLKKGTPFCSFPEAVRRFVIEDRLSVVCSGTHGKTTTSSWISFLFKELGLDPSFLIGGVPQDLDFGCHISKGEVFVGEGDEYDSAFFDKGPKFLHYKPNCAVINGIEFDHADIYRDLDHVKSSFEKLVALLPGDGLCVARYEDPNVLDVLPNALCPVQTFGLREGAMWHLGKLKESPAGYEFEIIYKNKNLGVFKSPLFGQFNLMNLLAGIVVASNLGQSIEKIRPIVERFRGVQRRQTVLREEPFTLIDDFAHHPTEVRATLSAVRHRFPKQKIWAFFEPRSATARRKGHEPAYVKAFEMADHIIMTPPYRADLIEESDRFGSATVVRELEGQGKKAQTLPNGQEIADFFEKNRQPGDVAVVMSNGEFDKLKERLAKLS